MPALCDIAARHGLALIEDAAQAHGAHSSSAPSAGSGVPPASTPTGCFSLYATKNLTAGEGGVVTTNDAAIAQRLRRLRSHGEADRYESIEVGYNYRITEVGAALALAQLDGLAEANQRRRENAAYLTQHLRGVVMPEAPADAGLHVWHQYTVLVAEGRDGLQLHLRERGIEAMVYYPKTLPAQKLYRDLGYDESRLPIAVKLANEVLSLPVHPGLSRADLETIVAAVNEWTAANSPGNSPLSASGEGVGGGVAPAVTSK
jgi:dTDP-4-amino-4,6-dideoxygalactose transaminase